MATTINTKFSPASLPRWAQNTPPVVELCKARLSYRCDVHTAKTHSEKARLKQQAQRETR